MDLDWHATPQLAGLRLSQPVIFIAGASDMVPRALLTLALLPMALLTMALLIMALPTTVLL